MPVLVAGTLVGGHRVVRHLGSGRFADVYEAVSPDGARRALKLLREELAGEEKPRARLGQESEAVGTIEHVHVIAFHGAGEDEDLGVFLLIELVDGPDLAELARREGGRLPVERAVRLLRQACEGVAAAHARGILHRNLRPENLLIAPGDVLKVAGFGTVKSKASVVVTTRDLDSTSPLYTAPEYAWNKVATEASDVYALGLVLYEALAGSHPIGSPGDSPLSIVMAQRDREPRLLSAVRPEVPGDLSDLVARTLAKDPARRGTVRQLADDLGTVLDHLLAGRRAAARVLLADQAHIGLARTEPALTAMGAHGTVVMAAAGGGASRPATPPPAPRVTPAPPWPAPPAVRTLAPTVAMEVVASGDRRTTTAPVESRSSPVRAERRGGGAGVGIAIAVAALAIGITGAAVWLLGPGAPAPAARPTPLPSASAPAAPSGSAPARMPARGPGRKVR